MFSSNYFSQITYYFSHSVFKPPTLSTAETPLKPHIHSYTCFNTNVSYYSEIWGNHFLALFSSFTLEV